MNELLATKVKSIVVYFYFKQYIVVYTYLYGKCVNTIITISYSISIRLNLKKSYVIVFTLPIL